MFFVSCVYDKVLILTQYDAVIVDLPANGIQTNIAVPTTPMPSW